MSLRSGLEFAIARDNNLSGLRRGSNKPRFSSFTLINSVLTSRHGLIIKNTCASNFKEANMSAVGSTALEGK